MTMARAPIAKQTPIEFINQTIHCKARFEDDSFFVCDLNDVVRKHKLWTSQLPRVKPFYAVKCNDDFNVLSLLAQLGTGFDCASQSEIQKILDMKVPESRIIYANTYKQPSHIKYAADNNVQLMTFDSEHELLKIKEIHPTAKMVVRICPPGPRKCAISFAEKFGCMLEEVPHLLRVAKELGIDVVGVSYHIGGNCFDATAYPDAVESARTVFDLAKSEGFQLSLLDIGGGFPGYKKSNLTFEEICPLLRPSLDKHFPESMNVEIIAEPGQFFVASAYTLAVSIIARRDVTSTKDLRNDFGVAPGEKAKVGVDSEAIGVKSGIRSTYYYYVNDGVFGSFIVVLLRFWTFTPLILDEERFKDKPRYLSTVWGQTCNGADCITPECHLPELKIGDWLIFEEIGAYSTVAGSTFNGFQRPKCYYIKEDLNL